MWNPFKKKEAIKPEEDSLMAELKKDIEEDDAILKGTNQNESIRKPVETDKTELFSLTETLPAAGKEVSGVRKKPRSPQQEKYALESTGKELALKYAPEYLAAGGENIVYDIPGRPHIVAKGSKLGVYETLADRDSVNAETVEDSLLLMSMREDLKEESALRKKLFDYFGREHLPPQKKFLMKVPVTKAILDEAEAQFLPTHRSRIKKNTDEAWTFVTIQRRQDLPKEKHASASVGSLEMSILNYRKPSDPDYRLYKDEAYMEKYDRVSDALVRGEDEELTTQEIMEVIRSPGLRSVIKRIEKEEGFKEALKDFVEKAIEFAEDTGEILDIAGADNVALVKEDGEWTYKLLDPLYPFEDHVLESAREAYLMKQMNNKQFNILFQGLNFVRGLNAFAKLSGSKKRLEFLPKSLMNTSVREAMFGQMGK